MSRSPWDLWLSQFLFTEDGEGGDGDGDKGGDKSGDFTAPKDQAALDAIVTGRLARAKDQLKAEWKLDELTAKATELDALKAKAAADDDKRKADDAKKSGDVEKIEASWQAKVKDAIDAHNRDKQTFGAHIRGTEARIAITRVADRLHEDAKPVFAQMLMDSLGVDAEGEGGAWRVYPKDGDGRPAVGADGERLTIDQLTAGFLDKHKYMVKAENAGGGGQTQTGSKPPEGKVKEAVDRMSTSPTADNIAAGMAAIRDQGDQGAGA